VRFLHPRGWSYYATLRHKLHWNEGLPETHASNNDDEDEDDGSAGFTRVGDID
jgi:hypothetical protein